MNCLYLDIGNVKIENSKFMYTVNVKQNQKIYLYFLFISLDLFDFENFFSFQKKILNKG